MFESKRKKYLKKLKIYGAGWDTEEYGYVLVMADGRLCPSNNKDVPGLYLNKQQLFNLVSVIQDNT